MGLSIRAYAQHRGVSHTAVAKAIKAGRISKELDGTIDPVKADAAWERNTHPAQQTTVAKPVATPRGNPVVSTVSPTRRKPEPGSSPATAPDYQTSRAIREAYAARLAKLDFEERTGKLINADEAKVATFNLARRLRDRLLTLPRRLAAAFAAESDSRTIEQQLEDEIRQALEELSHEP